jgi:hypothetical protein
MSELMAAYMTQLTPMEQKVLQIAASHLETSFSLVKSIGFLEWQAQAKQAQAKQAQSEAKQAQAKQAQAEQAQSEAKQEPAPPKMKIKIKKKSPTVKKESPTVKKESPTVKKESQPTPL